MKATGIVRKIDELGRITLPKELRTILQMGEADPIEIFTEDDKIILKKYQANNTCSFCNTYEDNIKKFFGKPICSKCVGVIQTVEVK